jgi:cell division protein FtsZ
MSIKLQLPELTDMQPRITVIGVGGAGGNAINNMIASGLKGVDFVAANTDAQALAMSSADRRLQLGATLTEGLGAGARPEIGEAAAEEAFEEIKAELKGSHMVFIAAGMGGGTGTGAAAVIARAARELEILTVAIVSKPFHFEGSRRMRIAEYGINQLKGNVDTLIVIPNQNLFRIANEKTTFAESFILADQVLFSGVACIVDLVIKDGLINLDFADVRAVMANMGSAVMGTGEADGDQRARLAAEEAISNPLLDNVSLEKAKGVLISIVGGPDMTLFEVDEAANRIREETNDEANIIVGATFDVSFEDRFRVSLVAAGMEQFAAARQVAADESGSEDATDADGADAASDEVNGVAAAPVLPPPLPQGAVATSSTNTASPTQAPKPPAAPNADRTAEFKKALLGSEPTGEPVAASQQETPWQASNGVVVEPEPSTATQSDGPAIGSQNTRSAVPPSHTPSQSAHVPSFEPVAPVTARPETPRFPTADQFPPVAQKVLNAKSEAGASEATPQQGRSGGLLNRLPGFGRKAESPAVSEAQSDVTPHENSSGEKKAS